MSEILYYLGRYDDPSQMLTLVVVNTETKVVMAFRDKTYFSPPGLDVLYGWQNFVVSKFPDVNWNAKVKVNMTRLDTPDKPQWINKSFTMELKGEWNDSYDKASDKAS